MASSPPPSPEEDASSLDISIDDDSVAVAPSVIAELDYQSTNQSTVSCANNSISQLHRLHHLDQYYCKRRVLLVVIH